MKKLISPKFLKLLFICIRPIVMVLMIAVLWELVRHIGLFERESVPGSITIFEAFVKQVQSHRFWEDLSATLYRSLGGLLIALLIGIPCGLFIGSNRFLKPTGMPLIDFLRSIPVTTLYPVVVLTLGIGDKAKIGMIFLGCVLIIMLQSAAGFEQRSRIRHQVSRLYGASPSYLLFRVSFFEALPSIMTGIRVAVGFAMIICTLTEMFMGANRGMGQSLMEAYSIYNLPVMYAYIGTLGLTGYIINRLCIFAETRVKLWRNK